MSILLSVDLVDKEFVFDSARILKTGDFVGFEGFLNLLPPDGEGLVDLRF